MSGVPADRPPAATEWTRLVPSDVIAPGQIVDVGHGETDLVVWRTSAGEPCVMSARCPHLWSHLAGEGVVEDDELICCTHGWRFATCGTATVIRSGSRDAMTNIAVYPVAERDGEIWGELPTAEPEV